MQQSVDELTDVELLSLIASQRDEDAFSELFARYKRASYSLALTIVGDAKYAEEVVQEAMIRVWSSAGKFRTDVATGNTNPKGWILKIIAREASRALQRKHKRSKEISQNIELASAPAEDQASSSELLQALRRKIAELAEEDRQLIALHFGGGLSQTEISETLAVSQQSVSNRIQRMLRELRAGLAASGFACATVAVTNHLESILSSGHTPSADLQARMMTRLQLRPSVRKARRVKTTSSTPYAAVAGVVSALAGVGLWFALAGNHTASAIPAAAPAPVVAIPSPAAGPQTQRWVFDRAAAGPELRVGVGSWKWLSDKKAMLAPDVVVGFSTVKLPEGPAVFTLKSTAEPGGGRVNFGMRMFFEDGKFHDVANWRRHNLSGMDPTVVRKTYFVGNYLIDYWGDTPVRVLEHDRSHANGYLVMLVSHLMISEMEIKPIDSSELPAELRDPSKLTHDMVRVDLLSKEELAKLENE
jgi:RNA polymerase sigma-70 factor (ECF subfamily)